MSLLDHSGIRVAAGVGCSPIDGAALADEAATEGIRSSRPVAMADAPMSGGVSL